jgi:Tfp pilus assembly major pilin PilA
MSLVEATVILGVIALLAAILAPAVRAYVLNAQQVAARNDAEEINAGLTRFLTDVGEGWFLRSGVRTGTATDQGAPSHAAGNRVDLLVSDGKVPAVDVARSGAGTEWSAAVDDAAVQKLEYFLVTNKPSNNSANAYRIATSMSGAGGFDPDAGSSYNSPFSWRGPYLAGPISADPWGNRYAVNVEFLAHAQASTPSGNVNDVFVISAGPNGLIENRIDTDGISAGNNDVISLISGGTR